MPQDNFCRDESHAAPMRASLIRAAAGAALVGFAVCAGAIVARAGGNDVMSSQPSIYDKFLEVIGVNGPGDEINYNERSPLVIPPTRDLPPPGADVSPPVPDWPKDPDLTRAAKAKAAETVGPHPDWAVELAQPLRPDQLNVPGAKSRASGARGPDGATGADHPESSMPNKGSIFSFDWFKKEQYATFTGEPPRTRLTDPPPGYLTPSPDQPYGVGPEEKHYKPPTVADRVTPVSGTSSGN